LRFPGQYLDKETGLFYNYFRDYDSQTGRYVQSDPIGLEGGINPYIYAYDDPLRFSDPKGLDVYMCKRPLRALGGSGTRSGPDIFGNPLYHQYACVVIGGTQICGGQTIERSRERDWWPWGPGLRTTDDRFNPDTCTKLDESVCMDNCMMSAIANPYRPSYGLFGPGTNCQGWVDDALAKCRRTCKGKP
jgi:RHS repeat-associated protein